MSYSTPYLHRRGDTFCFRMGIPADVRHFIKGRELTKSLQTSDRLVAQARCLALAARVKNAIQQIRQMKKKNQQPQDFNAMEFKMFLDFNEFGKPQSMSIEAEEHEQEAVERAIKAVGSAFQGGSVVVGNSGDAPAEAGSPAISFNLKLHAVALEFLEQYPQSNAEMLKKHNSCIPAFCEIVSNMAVSELRRAHIQDFFETIVKLPPRWADIKRKDGASIRQIADQQHDLTISGKTFEYTYKTSISQFLKWAHDQYGDQGFPDISIVNVKYKGDRKDGESKQRPFKPAELQRLFTGSEMAEFTEHDLRAKCASDAESLEHARQLLAHADSKLTERVYRRKPIFVAPVR